MQTGRLFRFSAIALIGLGLAADAAGAQSGSGRIIGTAIDASTGRGLAGVTVVLAPSGMRARSNPSGAFALAGVAAGSHVIKCVKSGYRPSTAARIRMAAGGVERVTCRMMPLPKPADKADRAEDDDRGGDAPAAEPEPAAAERSAPAKRPARPRPSSGTRGRTSGYGSAVAIQPSAPPPPPVTIPGEPSGDFNTEQYDKIDENPYKSAERDPLSTLSIDVDTASYSNVRRFIEQQNRLPPKDAVKIEEMINYFNYDYPAPRGEVPFSVTTEMSIAPWNPSHRLVHIGIQGRKIPTDKLPASNLVFLIDVSGSMSSPNKLPLLIQAFKLLVNNLRAKDRVAIAVYAGAAGLVLPSTPGSRKGEIIAALERLQAGGSTAGAAGIELAYRVARKNFIRGGNNRVILATDGDFNVGTSSDGDLVRLIEGKRKQGVFLTVLGFGMGNYKDSKMEKLADKGNGNHAYIDSILEAKKVLVSEMGGTLHAIAKDVKIQIEFNPAKVKAYRLIGYENRLLRAQDFNDDTKDAGELGSGHTVTALYEVIPAGSNEKVAGIDELRYQRTVKTNAAASDEIMTVKLRYKPPTGDRSKLISRPLKDTNAALARTSNNFRWSAAVAEFGMLLRDSEHRGSATYDTVISRAKAAAGKDPHGYRYEFIKLVQKAKLLAPATQQVAR